MKVNQTLPDKTSKLRILWINQKANFTGGTENYIYKTVSLLNSRGIESSLLYDVDPWTEPQWTSIFSEAYPLVDLKTQIDSIKPDIVYLHQWPGGQVLNRLLSIKIPVIRFIHDSEIFSTKEFYLTTFGRKSSMHPDDYKWHYPILQKLQYLKSFLKYKKDILISNQNKKQTMKCNKLIVASHYLKQHLIEHKVNKSLIAKIPLFVENSIDKTSSRKNQILFVGQLVRGKGLDTLLHALAKLTTTPHLIVCGDGKQKSELQKLSKYLKLEHQVKFKGFVHDEELKKYYAESSCLVIPSRVPETFCLTGIEGISRKTPVIATSLGGMTEWQTPDSVFTFKENNSESLRGVIEKVLSDQTHTSKFVDKAYQNYLKSFTPEQHIDKLINLFQDTVKESVNS
ncbi:MAG: glycosyltransferase family 4 protein [Lentisphaeraceae bacterium]|nr:glycosyltransferase family 4 protein [Lentisphaeraceae bacterium]